MVDLSRLMQDAAILEVIDKSADEASNLSAQNSYQAMRIEELERENAKLRKHCEAMWWWIDNNCEFSATQAINYRLEFPKEPDK